MSLKSWAKTKKLGVAGWKVGQLWHRDNCSHAKKYNKKIKALLAKQNFSLLIWDRQLKLMLQYPTAWSDRKQLKYPSKELLLYDFLHKRSTWCLKDCDKQRLQTTVSINLSKSFAGHTGDVKTASICTTELWDALKNFILTSLKIKVAPYPIIVSLDPLSSVFLSLFSCRFTFEPCHEKWDTYGIHIVLRGGQSKWCMSINAWWSALSCETQSCERNPASGSLHVNIIMTSCATKKWHISSKGNIQL